MPGKALWLGSAESLELAPKHCDTSFSDWSISDLKVETSDDGQPFFDRPKDNEEVATSEPDHLRITELQRVHVLDGAIHATGNGFAVVAPKTCLSERDPIRTFDLGQVRPQTVFAERVVGKPYLEITIDREALALDREAIASSIASGFKKCAEASEAIVVQNTEKLPEHCLKSAQCFACYRNV